jgi:zinc transport system permease protein
LTTVTTPLLIPLGQIDPLLLERWAQKIGPNWHGYDVGALLSVLLISTICGLVGALVVGNRMAFFSDAMAHCAFAGISLGLLIALAMGFTPQSEELQWLLPLIMAAFGALIGVGIAFVRENTGLASDTVIGVFFAGAIGFGAMILQAFSHRRAFDPERFLFGGPTFVQPLDLLILTILLLLTVVVLVWRYNQFVLASFNPSLARSRGVRVQMNNYLFVVLLALIVNFSITAVGVLLINALLIVPAATASNVSRDMRRMFRWTLGLSLVTGLAGLVISQRVSLPLGPGGPKQFGVSGTIICVGVLCFAASMAVAALKRRFAYLG